MFQQKKSRGGVVSQALPELGTWTIESEVDEEELSGKVDVESWNEEYQMNYGVVKSSDQVDTMPHYRNMAGVSIGGYALFAGGYTGASGSYTYYSSTVYVYNSSLVRSTISALKTSAEALASASTQNYVLFGGGYNSGSTGYTTTYIDSVTCYNNSLVQVTVNGLLNARAYLAATTAGDYIIFAGGASNSGAYTLVDAYNINLVRSNPTSLNTARGYLAGTSINNYALFGGGVKDSTYYKVVEGYNSSLIRQDNIASLSEVVRYLAASSNQSYALFGGGERSSYGYAVSYVNTYNTSLIKSSASSLQTERQYLQAICLNDYILFGGGYASSNNTLIDGYSPTLVKFLVEDLSQGRQSPATAVAGKYALFVGNYSPTSSSSTPDIYCKGYSLYSTNQMDDVTTNSLYNGLINKNLLMPKESSEAATSDDIFIGTNSTSPTISTYYKVRASGFIPTSATLYVFIKKSLFNLSKYSDSDSASDALQYLNIFFHSVKTGNNTHASFIAGSNSTTTHYQFILNNVYNYYTPVRIYLQN